MPQPSLQHNISKDKRDTHPCTSCFTASLKIKKPPHFVTAFGFTHCINASRNASGLSRKKQQKQIEKLRICHH